VVATILLLALTVVLFSAIFAFVSAFPSPPAQNSNQFQATLLYNSASTKIVGLNITHLAGPFVPDNGLIYLKSSAHPSDCPFTGSVTVGSGISGPSWTLGEVWSKQFTAFPGCSSYAGDSIFDNITVLIVSASNLIFSVVLPGQILGASPTITSTWTNPGTPVQGAAFRVLASVTGKLGTNKPWINLGGIPHQSSTSQQMWFNSTSSQWQFNVTSGNTTLTTAGTYTGFVNVTGAGGATTTAVVTITIVSSSSGNGPLSVAVILVPSPPNSGTKESLQAVVTYTGTAKNAGVTVSFYGNQTAPTASNLFSSTGPSGVTITGPATVTVASVAAWPIPSPTTSGYSYSVFASATVVGVGTVTGSISFTPSLITLSTTTGLVGSSFTVNGYQFAASTGVTLSLGGVSVTPTGCTTGVLAGATVTTTAAGLFVCAVKVIPVSPGVATIVLATDATSGQNDTNSFTVAAWTVSLSVSSGLLGSSTTATGAGFAGASGVTFTIDGFATTPTSCSTGNLVGATVTTTAAGAFVCAMVVPYAAGAGPAPVVATDASSTQSASAVFTATAATLALSPTSGLHSSSITVTLTGAGFAGTSSVSITYNGVVVALVACTTGSLSSATITTTAAGAFVCTYTIASGGTNGVFIFAAIDATSGQSATAYFTRT
jgi:hypothetical protein